MKLRAAAALAFAGYFLVLAAILIFSGASLSGLTIHDIEKAFSWRDLLVYLCFSILGGYLIAVGKRRQAKPKEKTRDG